MINEIIELLPSADLKAKIRVTGHSFKEKELLQIIYRYSPNYDAKLKLLERFSEIASPEISALAKVYIDYEQTKFKRFTESAEGFVYELCIKETPDSAEEKYLCASYSAALACIDRFYEEYACIDSKETEKTKYEITKRKVFAEGDAFEEDAYASLELGAEKTVLSGYDYKDSSDCELDVLCSECEEICHYRCDEIDFPCYVQNYGLIKYSDYEGKECFGVVILLDGFEKYAFEYYVISLYSSVIKERRFEEKFYAHEHVELPLARLATPDELDEVTRKNYCDFVEYLKANEDIIVD